MKTNERTCEIKWVGADGLPTPDANAAVGYVRCLGYPVEGSVSYKPAPSRWYAICLNHLPMMPLDGFWEFVREVSREVSR